MACSRNDFPEGGIGNSTSNIEVRWFTEPRTRQEVPRGKKKGAQITPLVRWFEDHFVDAASKSNTWAQHGIRAEVWLCIYSYVLDAHRPLSDTI